MQRTKAAAMMRLLMLPIFAAMVLAGCIDHTLDFTVRFDHIQNLHEGAPVLHDETQIGKVQEIAYNSGAYWVSVAIEERFADAATDVSQFYIDSGAEPGGEKIVRVIQTAKNGRRIAEGAVVEGRTKYAALYGQLASRFRENLSVIESELDAFFQELKTFSESEQIQGLEKKLNEIIADLGDMSVEMKHKLETEVLPFIRRQIEELRRRLEKTGEEEKLRYVDQKIELITARLRS
jgi:hypothetical protein